MSARSRGSMAEILSCEAGKVAPADWPLGAGNGADDEKWLFSGCDFVGQQSVRRLQGIVFRAGEETQERTALLRDMIAYRAAQHRILCFEGIEHGALCDWPRHVQLNLGTDPRHRSQKARKHDADHGSVWTSTESTAGRCSTIGAQLLPASAEPYTCPPVAPK